MNLGVMGLGVILRLEERFKLGVATASSVLKCV